MCHCLHDICLNWLSVKNNYDSIPEECLKKGGMAVLESLVSLLDEYFDKGTVSTVSIWTV